MTEFEKMVNGEDFDGFDPEITALRNHAAALKQQINNNPGDTLQDLMKQLLGSFGAGSIVTPPFLCEFGKTIHIGHNTFVNMGVTMLDNTEIHIGDNVLIGPNAQFYTPTHSLDYQSRRRWETTCKPIVVEDDVWIGGQVVICQGVTIGARSVIAANSTVTKDVPPDTLVGGSPARIIKQLC
ncbi:sugar O-acetyltransferase [Photobacterium sp. OFAV2-7]|uniref:sugar O-acetyltransferase n=1 Tax=Photobacterium sp. OFAV2-7 TaxID=2917748 RepID=UPI001EF547A6|nr:sugar O-acetyltransferase [Photobacterium sp. OFAV2-7]MCG7585002.1 sugar O-acetyltransferase [Photobacterium sp. OFAV2-7]